MEYTLKKKEITENQFLQFPLAFFPYFPIRLAQPHYWMLIYSSITRFWPCPTADIDIYPVYLRKGVTVPFGYIQKHGWIALRAHRDPAIFMRLGFFLPTSSLLVFLSNTHKKWEGKRGGEMNNRNRWARVPLPKDTLITLFLPWLKFSVPDLEILGSKFSLRSMKKLYWMTSPSHCAWIQDWWGVGWTECRTLWKRYAGVFSSSE